MNAYALEHLAGRLLCWNPCGVAPIPTIVILWHTALALGVDVACLLSQ
jgi:hypothetical protein